MVSPKCIKGVVALPWAMISNMRFSAMHEDPALRSTLETVPEPIIVHAHNGRVLAAWASNCGKEKVMSTPAFGWPNNVSFK